MLRGPGPFHVRRNHVLHESLVVHLCCFSPDDANDHSGDAAVDAEGAHDVVIQ